MCPPPVFGVKYFISHDILIPACLCRIISQQLAAYTIYAYLRPRLQISRYALRNCTNQWWNHEWDMNCNIFISCLNHRTEKLKQHRTIFIIITNPTNHSPKKRQPIRWQVVILKPENEIPGNYNSTGEESSTKGLIFRLTSRSSTIAPAAETRTG